MEGVRIQNKIKLLFEKIAEPNYVMSNYYADGLIEKLSKCSDPEIEVLGKTPLPSDLIIDTLNSSIKVHNTVQVFITRLLALVARKEVHFTKIFSKQSDKILEGFKEINSPNMNASLRVAFMEVALGVVKHNSGICWLLETGVWKEILSLCNEKRTVFVVRQTYKFAAEFLWKLNDLGDQANVAYVLGFILKPLQQIEFIKVESISTEEENEISKTVDPMLHILLAVANTENRVHKSSLLLSTLLKEYSIISHIYVLIDRLRNEETSMLLGKLIFWMMLAKCFLCKPSGPDVMYHMDDFKELGATYLNIIKFFVQRRSATLVLDFCTTCNLIWSKVCTDKDNKKSSVQTEHIKLRNQMLFMCLVPPLVFVKYGKCKTLIMSDERLEDYIVKLLNASCEYTAKGAYVLRDLIEELDTLPIILQSVKKLTCLRYHLNDEQANLMFQGLFYVLREYLPAGDCTDFEVPNQEECFEDSEEKVLIMTYVMDTILYLVKKHNINWHQSLEVICLYNVVYGILKRPNLTTKFIVVALNVIAMSVKKFLPPNLSLLLESTPGTAMNQLGKLIYMKMHDLHWEVRDSALELLLVCTEISYIKFPPFQKEIMENNLINVAAAIAFNDYESYVQVSALKCIGAATKITNIWEQLKPEYPNIQDQLLSVLSNSQEGIVRKEACNVLCDVYQNLKLTSAFKQTLYEHMVSAALSDFHWEVQLSALKFWRIVYQSLLSDQGMLDGKFPPVTFSRETRKIVTLNEAEIQKRLLKILEELASIGCLTVLVKLLQDDSEVDIMDSTLALSLEIIEIVNKYKVECVNYKVAEPGTVDDLLDNIKEEILDIADEDIEGAVVADNVIESILNVDDINLLANIYERHMSLQSIKPDPSMTPKIKLIELASPYMFVNFLKSKDFKAIVEEKRKWNEGIRSVSSLLDDVLGIYETNEDVNSLDCY